MPVHLLDQRELGRDHAVQFLRDELEPVTHRRLDVGERRGERRPRGRGGAHRDFCSVAASRSEMSRNWMSTAKTRS